MTGCLNDSRLLKFYLVDMIHSLWRLQHQGLGRGAMKLKNGALGLTDVKLDVLLKSILKIILSQLGPCFNKHTLSS